MLAVISNRHFLWRCLVSLLSLIQCTAAYQPLSQDTLKLLPRPGTDFDIHDGKLLAPILRTRVPGTPGSTAVLNHFNDFFKTSLPDWTIEFQNSTSKTPVTGNKEVPFVNFIAYRDPPWASKGEVGRLTLVAHYDSKLHPEGFIGAIDSAAPCAMIMHAARSIDTALSKKWSDMEARGDVDSGLDAYTGIQVLFLDGEEAFQTWTESDSLYGARSLAEAWEHSVHPAMSTFKTSLSAISLFVLLDLLGSKDPWIQSYFPTTHWAYQKLADLEIRMRAAKEFKSSPNYGVADGEQIAEPHKWLVDAEASENSLKSWSTIQDDHIPFMRRGVDVLHIIDTPNKEHFPDVWHRIEDDGEHLDLATVEDWSMLIGAFVAEWLELEGYFGEPHDTEMLYSRKTEFI